MLDRTGDRSSVFGKSRRRETRLAVAGQLGQTTGNSINFCFLPDRCACHPQPRLGLDFSQLHAQLLTHKHLTLHLLWEEYRETHPDGYGYSRLCELYQRWNRNQDVVLRQDHIAGEKMFVDWAGDTVPVHDRETGE
ncbi:MAG: IS21 family transposase, partial [Acidobacteriota bacterium]|nr:IS21 family transposase [Acidobacteriota bacterium]